MKFTNLRAFEKHVEGASLQQHFSELYLLISKDPFEKKSAEDFLTKHLLKDSKEASNIIIFEGDRLEPENILNELETISLFAQKRIVIIRLSGEKIPKQLSESLESYFAKPNPAICLVITTQAVNRATNFYKKAEKAGIVFDPAEEKPWEKEKSLGEWVFQKFSKEGKKIDPQLAQVLVKQLGSDQGTLSQEIEKLICFLGDRKEVAKEDVNAVCSILHSDTGWQLCDTIFRKDAGSAIRIAKSLLNDGTAVIALLRQVRSQFQTLCQINSILTAGGSPQDITQLFPYMRGSLLEKNIASAKNYGLAALKKGLLLLDDTELKAKNSEGEPDFLVEFLIIKLTT